MDSTFFRKRLFKINKLAKVTPLKSGKYGFGKIEILEAG
jgi:hypothetical protein